MSDTPTAPDATSQPPTYTIALRPAPDVGDPRGHRALRSGLKMLLRKYGLKCVRIVPGVDEAADVGDGEGDKIAQAP